MQRTGFLCQLTCQSADIMESLFGVDVCMDVKTGFLNHKKQTRFIINLSTDINLFADMQACVLSYMVEMTLLISNKEVSSKRLCKNGKQTSYS